MSLDQAKISAKSNEDQNVSHFNQIEFKVLSNRRMCYLILIVLFMSLVLSLSVASIILSLFRKTLPNSSTSTSTSTTTTETSTLTTTSSTTTSTSSSSTTTTTTTQTAQPSSCVFPCMCGAIAPLLQWQAFGSSGITMIINTTICNFNQTPIYFTSITGSSTHWVLGGYSAIFFPTKDSFTIYATSLSNHTSSQLLSLASIHSWDVDWFGMYY